MSPRVSCLCGERIELGPGQPLTSLECPTCGRTIDLSPPRFDQPAVPGIPAATTAESGGQGHAVVCPDCGGTGRCRLCSSSQKRWWAEALAFVDSVFDAVFGVFANASASSPNHWYGSNRHISSRHYQTKGCVACNGRRKCYKCNGSGAWKGA